MSKDDCGLYDAKIKSPDDYGLYDVKAKSPEAEASSLAGGERERNRIIGKPTAGRPWVSHLIEGDSRL